MIIDNGKIIHDGDLATLKDTYARDRVIHFQVSGAIDEAAVCAALPTCEVAADGTHLSIRFDRFKLAAGEIAAAVMRHVDVVDFRIDEPEVEALIRRVYLGQLNLADGAEAPDASQAAEPSPAALEV